jgi:hypothetical protein
MTSRRAFLSTLLTTAAAAKADLLDLDRLMWVPGEKKIFIPPARQIYITQVSLCGYGRMTIRHLGPILYPIKAGDVLMVDFSKNELLSIYPNGAK